MAGLKRKLAKAIGATAGLLLVLGVAAPFVHADRYRARMQSSLSSALGREVSIDGHVSFSLLPGPALAVDNVKIAEADASSEPFAYVNEVRAVPRLYSFWTGHLEFSSLTLDGAHVNLVRQGTPETPSWNFEPLLRPGLLAAFPTIHMRDSRINFVLDGRKSPFYLLGADLDVSPRSTDGSDWSVRFTGAPARSDRPARGFGAVEASGSWKRAVDANGVLALDIRLARSQISDILALLYGRDAGIHGIISGQAHVAGVMHALGIEGQVSISELHGWDQSPPASIVFPIRVSGTLDTPAQHLDLFAQAFRKAAARTETGLPQWILHLNADSYLEKPLVKMDFHSDGLPIGPLPGLLHNFGANLPEGLQVTGMMNGSVAFDSRGGWTGNAVIPEATLLIQGNSPLKLENAAFAIIGTQIHCGPVLLSSGDDQVAEASAGYSLQDGSFQVTLVSVKAPLTALSQRFPAAYIPFLSQVRAGLWSGQVTYSQTPGQTGRWYGEGDLQDATVSLPALSAPLDVTKSHLSITGDDIQLDHMMLRAGPVDVTGDYRYSNNGPAPHQFHLNLSRASLSEIETLLAPSLNHGGSLIDRALGRSAVPQWLLNMKAAGTVQVEGLDAVVADLSRVRANVLWQGTHLELNGVAMRSGSATLSGALTLDLRNPKPRYSGSGTWTNLPWKEGSLSGNVTSFETLGTGLETVTNLKLRGDLTGADLDLAPLGQIGRMTATYSALWSGAALRFRFPTLRLTGDSGEVWTGSGTAQGGDGEVTLQLSGGRQMTLVGSLTDSSKDWVER